MKFRRFILFSLSLALPPFGWPAVLRGEEPARLIASTSVPTRSDALTYHVGTLGDGPDINFHLVTFQRHRCTLRVIDLGANTTVAQGVLATSGLAGVNGGYFTPDHSPLGLVIHNGNRTHPFEHSKILTGLLVVTPRGASLLRTTEFRANPQIQEALQAGPFLVDHGKAVPGLNATRAAERTVLLADKTGVIGLLTTGPITLAALADVLASSKLLVDLKLERALNLDGGSSTALWVATVPEPFSKPEWKQVRNAVVVVPK